MDELIGGLVGRIRCTFRKILLRTGSTTIRDREPTFHDCERHVTDKEGKDRIVRIWTKIGVNTRHEY